MDQPQADQQSVSRQELSPEPTSSSPNDSAPDASPGSRRFKVAQVQFDTPSPRQTMDGSQPAGRGVNSPVVESPSPSHQASMFDVTATIGYATNEAVPMTVFYRDGGPDRARPTLQALRKGFEADQDQEVWTLSFFPCVYLYPGGHLNSVEVYTAFLIQRSSFVNGTQTMSGTYNNYCEVLVAPPFPRAGGNECFYIFSGKNYLF